MGVSQSKGAGGGGVRWKLQPLVPRSWAELEQLHLRFLQEAHRRRADPSFQYFLPFPVFQAIVAPLCPDKDKLQLLAMFEALDVNGTRKLAAVDFFSGLALLVDAKKPQKLEFVLSLLDNGGLKTLNKCELTMVVSAASRGLKMFAPGADVLQESTMRPLIRRLFGDNSEVLRQNVVNKALADPEILFFMSDLEAGVATSSDELLLQQGKLMRQMAYLDYQAARVETGEEKGRVTAALPAGFGPSKGSESQRALTAPSVPTAENFARRLQSVVCPPPPKGSGQSMRVLSAVEVKKYVDARTLQRLVRVVSDGGLSLSLNEATTLMGDMAADQFGLVRCGDILRVLKSWVQSRRREKPEALWELVGDYVVEAVKDIEKKMNAVLGTFVGRTTKNLGPGARRRTTVAKDRLIESLQNIVQTPDSDDGELQWSVNFRFGMPDVPREVPTSSPTSKRAGTSPNTNIRFRIGIHPPGSPDGDVKTKAGKSKLQKEGQPDYDSDDSQPEDVDEETMRLIFNFLLNPDIADEDGIDLASSMEKALQQEQVWSSFGSLLTKCSVTVHSAVRSDGGIQPVLGKYLRICINFREDFISNVEECTGTSFAAGIRSFFMLGELDLSLMDIIKTAKDMGMLLLNLGKRHNRERAMGMIFDAFDSDHTGVWTLQEFNTFQQALGKEALLEVTVAELFGVDALERIIEQEGDSEKLWTELALTQFQLWEAHVRALHMPSILELSSGSELKRPRGSKGDAKPVHTQLLQEAYCTFLIAMEYPNSKSSPELLLPLVRLYIEFGSYRGALAVCTLLVEGYPTSPRLNEAIFLSALTASALGRHRESAQYFQYLAEGQGSSSSLPYRLAAYQFGLLAALELALVPGMRALERETYTQAYKALVALPPVLPSEKTAHTLHGWISPSDLQDQPTHPILYFWHFEKLAAE
ncbi:hypothetical protein PR001_g5966 [Phytophthora rubi]|uniref:Uncharacterized protein n=1 Tax=Phytophthora rubi TaxID=129364 RepID=A0A6A3NRE9_9STRA|nr:hypothetical protein PR001_g5966 [Phytophthora rubi]